MRDKDIYRTLKLIQKGVIKKRSLPLICDKLITMDLIRPPGENVADKIYGLSIKGKVFIWDWENWKL